MNDEVRNEEIDVDEAELAEQETAEFEAAFAGEESPTEETLSESEEAPAEEAQEAEPADTEVPSITAADLDRARLEAAAEAEQKYTKRVRDLSGEVGGLRQKLELLTTAKAAADDQGAESPTTKQVKEASTSSTKLAALKEDFPEFAEAIEEALEGIKPVENTNIDELSSSRQAAEEARERAESTAQQLNRLTAIRSLDKAHSDWEEVVTTDGYKQWLAVQSDNIRYAADQSEDARDAITILNMYKESDLYKQKAAPDTTAPRRRVDERLESAVLPTAGKQAQRPSYKTEQDEFEAAFNS